MKKNTKTWWIAAGIAAVIIILFVLSRQSKNSGVGGDPTQANADDWIKGGVNARVTLIEYGDFQCPACAAYQPLVKEVHERFGNQLKIVYRHFPLTQIHQYALVAARAAEAAGRQGKFWEMHDVLFEKQSEWSTGRGSPEGFFVTYAKDLGLDEAKFSADYQSAEVRDAVTEDLASANKLNLRATPSFLLNGKLIASPRSAEEFAALIEAALKNTPLPEITTNTLAAAPDVHEHADFAVYLNGKKFDFSLEKYRSDKEEESADHDHDSHQHDPYVHLHDNNGAIIHKHKQGVTLGYFFKSLGMELSENCLTTDDGAKNCTDEKNSLKFFVNGARQTAPQTYELKDLDRILISYGPLTDPSLQDQLGSLTDEACIYSEKCPERGQPPTEACVGGLGSDCVQ